MSIKKAQQQVDQWIQNHGVRYFNELTNMETDSLSHLPQIF